MEYGKRILHRLFLATKNIKKSHALFFSTLPSCLLLFFLYTQKTERKWLEKKFYILEKQEKKLSAYQKKIDSSSDPSHLSLVFLESAPLLTSELDRIQSLAKQYPNNPIIEKRLSFLKSNFNRIKFVSDLDKNRSGDRLFKLEHPVQMDEKDLNETLLLIEGESKKIEIINSEYLIKELKIKKEITEIGDTVYQVEMECIQKKQF